jgi:hypothetical protein
MVPDLISPTSQDAPILIHVDFKRKFFQELEASEMGVPKIYLIEGTSTGTLDAT